MLVVKHSEKKMSIGYGENGVIDLPFGEEVILNTNRVVEVVLTFSNGSVISTFVLPNNPMKITNHGDIVGCNVLVKPVESDL